MIICAMAGNFIAETIKLKDRVKHARLQVESNVIPTYKVANKTIRFKDYHGAFNLFLTLSDDKTFDPFNNPYFELKSQIADNPQTFLARE